MADKTWTKVVEFFFFPGIMLFCSSGALSVYHGLSDTLHMGVQNKKYKYGLLSIRCFRRTITQLVWRIENNKSHASWLQTYYLANVMHISSNFVDYLEIQVFRSFTYLCAITYRKELCNKGTQKRKEKFILKNELLFTAFSSSNTFYIFLKFYTI